MKKILVLCTSNSARSQLAEGYFNFYASDYATIYSAGIQSKGINPYTLMVMAEDNLDISHQISKSYSELNDIEFDFLITVCSEVVKNIPSVLQYKAHVHLPFTDPDQLKGEPLSKLSLFRKVRDQIKKEVIKFAGEYLIPVTQKAA